MAIRQLAYVLACLALAGYGRRVQTTSDSEEDQRRHEVHNPAGALAKFLLAANPASGWQVRSPLASGGNTHRLSSTSSPRKTYSSRSGHVRMPQADPSWFDELIIRRIPMPLAVKCFPALWLWTAVFFISPIIIFGVNGGTDGLLKWFEFDCPFDREDVTPAVPQVLAINALISAIINIWQYTTPFVKPEQYDIDDLDDLEDNSLARTVKDLALEGTVPTTLTIGNGTYPVATFAGGAFWLTELAFTRTPGVIATAAGYTQGTLEKPKFDSVVRGGYSGHTQAVMLAYDPEVVTYGQLCDKFFTTFDPTKLNECREDVGKCYRSGIYFHTEEQEAEAVAAIKREQATLGNDIVTEVKEAKIFWPAEKMHQRFLAKRGQSEEKGADETEPIIAYPKTNVNNGIPFITR